MRANVPIAEIDVENPATGPCEFERMNETTFVARLDA